MVKYGRKNRARGERMRASVFLDDSGVTFSPPRRLLDSSRAAQPTPTAENKRKPTRSF
jgi:hypothetical protein